MGLELLVNAADSLKQTENIPKNSLSVVSPFPSKMAKSENSNRVNNTMVDVIVIPDDKVKIEANSFGRIGIGFQNNQGSFISKSNTQRESGHKNFSIERLMSQENSPEVIPPVGSNFNKPVQSSTRNVDQMKNDKAKEYYEALLKKYPKEVINEILALNNFSSKNVEVKKEVVELPEHKSEDTNGLPLRSSPFITQQKQQRGFPKSASPNKVVAEVKPFDLTVSKQGSTVDSNNKTSGSGHSTSLTPNTTSTPSNTEQSHSKPRNISSSDEYSLNNGTNVSFLKKIDIESFENKSQSASFTKFCEIINEPDIADIKIPDDTKESVVNDVNFPDNVNKQKTSKSDNKVSFINSKTTQIFLPNSSKRFPVKLEHTGSLVTSAKSSTTYEKLKISNPFLITSTSKPVSLTPQLLFTRPPSSIPTPVLTMQKDSAQKKMIQSKLNMQDEDGDTLLHIAVAKEDAILSKSIIKKMDPTGLNILNRNGQAAIHIASYLDMKEAVQDLLISGADGTIVDKEGNTGLHIACTKGSSKLVDLFTAWSQITPQNKVLLSRRNNRGMAPIHIAVEKNNIDIVSKLAKCLESINVQEQKSGETALSMALRMSRWNIADILLNNRADVNIASFAGMYPLYYPTLAAREEMVTKMVQMGATPGKPKEWGDMTKIDTSMKKVLDKEMRRQRRKRKADSPTRSPVYRQNANI